MRDAACCRLATSRCTGGVKTTELACAVWRRVWLAIGQSGGLPPPTPPVSSFLFCPRSDRIFFGKGSSSCRSKAGGWRGVGGGREVPLPAPTRVWRERTALSPPEKSPAQTGGRGGQAAQAGRAELLAGVGGDAAQLLHQRLNQRLSTGNLENKIEKAQSCSRYGARTHD